MLNNKINIPSSTTNILPNVNNLTDEANQLSMLLNKTNRSNSGQNTITSTTSGKVYRTTDYPSEPTIYNKGETGLYNLLIKLYGGDNGWMFMAEDYNAINTEFDSVNTKIDNVNTSLDAKISTNATNVATNKTNITNLTTRTTKAEQDITGIKSGAITVTSALNSTNATYPLAYGDQCSLGHGYTSGGILHVNYRFANMTGYKFCNGDNAGGLANIHANNLYVNAVESTGNVSAPNLISKSDFYMFTINVTIQQGQQIATADTPMPSGFTKDNCGVVSCMVADSQNSWFTSSGQNGILVGSGMLNNGNIRTRVTLPAPAGGTYTYLTKTTLVKLY